jgi:hypothetical protein
MQMTLIQERMKKEDRWFFILILMQFFWEFVQFKISKMAGNLNFF